jgi:hypothetical protein
MADARAASFVYTGARARRLRDRSRWLLVKVDHAELRNATARVQARQIRVGHLFRFQSSRIGIRVAVMIDANSARGARLPGNAGVFDA